MALSSLTDQRDRRHLNGVLLALRLSTLFMIAGIACAHGAPDSLASQKATRTPAERKISSLLLDEIARQRRGQTQRTEPSPRTPSVKVDEKGRALVDIRAAVSPALVARVKELNGTIVSSVGDYDSTIAWIPLLKLEELAGDAAVRGIEPAIDPTFESLQPR